MSFFASKSEITAYSTMLVLYSLVLILFTFILYKVIKTWDGAHRCTIILMIVCLQLAAICKFYFFLIIIPFIVSGAIINYSLRIWANYYGESFTEWQFYIYHSSVTVCFQLIYLFLKLAIMLNTGIWGYFFLLILTHRDIRYDEINAAFMYEQEDSREENY